MATSGADILSVGMMTAVGVGAKQTATSVRAGISRLAETPILDKRFRPIVMGLVPEEHLPPLEDSIDRPAGISSREERMLRMAAPTLLETVADIGRVDDVPLFLAGPEARPERPAPVGQQFLKHLAEQSGVGFDLESSRLFPNGRAGGFFALAEAVKLLDSGGPMRILVGGVDSYLDLHLLGSLDSESRILGESVMDGLIPGEGAAFLLLGRLDRAGLQGVRVESVGTGIEKGHRYSDEAYLGDGLTEAFRSVFDAHAAGPQVRTVFAGLNGERFGAKEWGTAFTRSRPHFHDPFRMEHPVDCFGDPGASLGPLLVGLGAVGLREGHVEGPCLTWASSDREERGAALLRRMAT